MERVQEFLASAALSVSRSSGTDFYLLSDALFSECGRCSALILQDTHNSIAYKLCA